MRSNYFLTFAFAVVLAACAAPRSSDAPPKLAVESYTIPSQTPGIQLYIRNKHPDGLTRFSPSRTLLYVHGTTQAGETTFDLPLEQSSWMDTIAQHGYDVYLIDLRGYGASSRPPEMNYPPSENRPIVTADVALKDVEAAVDHILARRGLPRLDLMGWSWGATLTGAYTATHNGKVNRLVLYAPQWTREATAAGRQAALGAYQAWTPAQARDRLQAGSPEDRRGELFPPASFELWSAAALSTDPEGAQQHPPVVRTPNGAFQDTVDYWMAGKPLWDPSAVTVPTLVVRGEWDAVTRVGETQAVFDRLNNAPSRRMIEIGGGSHMIFMEKNRKELFREVQSFLDESNP
ncbi:alpha/beta hydrolase [Paraburkholderia lacunae]|uniref:Alpha/beta hydrolase n=2 Tax=Paraburkholderia lacunae TaxID=2211104 RepID=A0A370MWD3_9BURK|nr:alpha/beta hydrolase [Paraburkholderia lacunae]